MSVVNTSSALPYLPIKRFLPSIVTLFSLCIGVTSISKAYLGKFELAIALLVITCFLDFLDGAIARALQSATTFGAELDSLCDMVNFGICSPLVVYLWGTNTRKFGWLAVLFFVVSMGIRLARFNTLNLAPADERTKRNRQMFFQGVPAPAGAMLNLFPLCLSVHLDGRGFTVLTYASIVVSVLVGISLVATIPTFSLKGVKVNRNNLFLILLALNAIIALFVFDTVLAVLFMSLLYVCSIPFSVIAYRRTLRNESPLSIGKSAGTSKE